MIKLLNLKPADFFEESIKMTVEEKNVMGIFLIGLIVLFLNAILAGFIASFNSTALFFYLKEYHLSKMAGEMLNKE